MRVVAAVAVIILHVGAACVTKYGDVSAGRWWAGNIMDSATRWVVPVFVMLSGFLLLDPSKAAEPIASFYRKRAWRVGIPLIFWSIFYWYVWPPLWHGSGFPSVVSAARAFVLGSPFWHLDYLFIIIGVYIFTPVLRKLVSRLEPAELRFTIIVALLLAMGNSLLQTYFGTTREGGAPSYNAFSQFVPYLAYYLAGFYLGSKRLTRSQLAIVALLCVLAATATAAITSITVPIFGASGFGFVAYSTFSPTVVIMSLCVFLFIANTCNSGHGASAIIRWVAPSTLGVYLIHPVFLDVGGRFGITVSSLPVYLCWLPIVGVTVASFVVAGLLRRIPYVSAVVGEKTSHLKVSAY